MSRYYFIAGTAPPSARQIAASLNEFAEHLSHDLSLDAIAVRMGISRGTAAVLLRMLREKMGGQAI